MTVMNVFRLVAMIVLVWPDSSFAQVPLISTEGQTMTLKAEGGITLDAGCGASASVCNMVQTINALASNATMTNSNMEAVLANLNTTRTEIAGLSGSVNELVSMNIPDKLRQINTTMVQREIELGKIINGLTEKLNNVSAAVAEMYNCSAQGLVHSEFGCVSPIPQCGPPPSQKNADITDGISESGFYAYGSVVKYTCKTGYMVPDPSAVNGIGTSAYAKCDNHKWTQNAVCDKPQGTSCRDIWKKNQSAISGMYIINPEPYVLAVFCDMQTKVINSNSRGFTLCSKYYSKHAYGPRYLSQGFGRGNINLQDMFDLSSFSGRSTRWSSVDCRAIIKGGSEYFLHAASADPKALEASNNLDYDLVFYTNIMDDVKADPTNLFDLSRDDRGLCTADKLQTWDFELQQVNVVKGWTDQGKCMFGDGHHFCSANRNGAAFSNLRGKATIPKNSNDPAACAASQSDQIYWAWQTDDHYCDTTVVGTGCRVNANSEGKNGGVLQQGPTYAYNYLFVF